MRTPQPLSLSLGRSLPGLAATLAAVLVTGACSASSAAPTTSVSPSDPRDASAAPGWSAASTRVVDELPFTQTELAAFGEPWAMTFLPGAGETVLVTERTGRMHVRMPDGILREVSGVPSVVARDQGGLGDVIAVPGGGADGRYPIYLSWVVAGEGTTTGAVVGAATLDLTAARLDDLRIIWRQHPTVDGGGHFGHRLALTPDRRHLFVTSGDRQKFDPAQDLTGTLGKVVRLTVDGAPAPGNPYAGSGASEVWSMGHRNPLGIAFDPDGRLWSTEMGPRGGDELNLIEAGGNYGWPIVSNGTHYDGRDIPDHRAGDGYVAPSAWWDPSVSPSSLLIYSGEAFPQWRGDALFGALSGQALIRVDLLGDRTVSGDRYPMRARIREVEQAPDGSVWVLEDGSPNRPGRLLRLIPR